MFRMPLKESHTHIYIFIQYVFVCYEKLYGRQGVRESVAEMKMVFVEGFAQLRK